MPRLPRDVRDALSLTRGERVLAHAATAGGSHVAATGLALHLPDGEGGFVRLPWEQVLHAAWRDGSLTVRADDGGTGRRRRALGYGLIGVAGGLVLFGLYLIVPQFR